MESLNELKGLLSDISGKQDDIKQSQEEHKEKLAKLEEKFGKHDEILTGLERQGIATTRKPQILDMPIPGTNESSRVYQGYNLDLMGTDLKRIADMDAYSPRPVLKNYVSIADKDKTDMYARYLIDVLQAKRYNNPESIKRLNDMRTKTSLGTTVAATAGYLVPEEYAAEILGFARLSSTALRDCRIMPMASDVMRVPAELTSVSVGWETTDVDQALDTTNPTVSEVALTAYRVGAYTVASQDLIDDSAIDLVSWLTGLFAEALGQEMDKQVFQGTGSPCSGITTAICGYSVAMAGSISTITGTDLSSMITKLSSNKLMGAKFYFHRNVFHYIRTLATTTSEPIFSPIAGPVAKTIWEYPYEIVEQMLYTDGADKPIGIFGNLRNFIIGNRRQANTLDVDPYGLFDKAQTRFRIYWRIAMNPGLTAAYVRLMTKA